MSVIVGPKKYIFLLSEMELLYSLPFITWRKNVNLALNIRQTTYLCMLLSPSFVSNLRG